MSFPLKVFKDAQLMSYIDNISEISPKASVLDILFLFS